jgi:hypothetical protein
MIAAFIAERMSSYIAGGLKPETAARFTSGELGAIYRRNHYSRDTSGAFRVTPPPEEIPIEAARAKCNEAIKEILDYCKEESVKRETKAPEKNSLNGFEKMAEYARNPV